MLVVNLSPDEHLEVHAGGGFVHTHQAVTESHHEVQAEDNDENDDDDDGHGACGQDGLRVERADHTETSLTGDYGRYHLGHPGDAAETDQVVVQDKLKHWAVPITESHMRTSFYEHVLAMLDRKYYHQSIFSNSIII